VHANKRACSALNSSGNCKLAAGNGARPFLLGLSTENTLPLCLCQLMCNQVVKASKAAFCMLMGYDIDSFTRHDNR